MHNKILVIDFGSPYTQLVARKIRDLDVYCEIHPYTNLPSIDGSIRGIILSDGPAENFDSATPLINLKDMVGKLPILSLGHNAHLIAQHFGFKPSIMGDFGIEKEINLSDSRNSALFKGINKLVNAQILEKFEVNLPTHFYAITSTNAQLIAFESQQDKTSGVLAHPRIYQTPEGKAILQNFVVAICGCKQDWTPATFVKESIEILKNQLGNDKVVLGLSGGVDSSVAGLLIHKAIGENLTCIFVDTGLLRKNEFEQVLNSYKTLGLNIIAVDAKQKFYDKLKGITDPEQKRKSIGSTFIDVFDQAAQEVGGAKWLAQGTIYPDVIESVSVKGTAVSVKSHHNVGGLPKHMDLKIVEPLRYLFKDETRRVGKELQLPENILNRHPFPGPGLGIRILGEVTPEKVSILQEADGIYVDALRQQGLYEKIWQAGAILLPIQTVGVTNHKRTYEFVVALRAVNSVDGMTADWYPLPYEFLKDISNKIIKEVNGVNRVVYDISAKPPATIEWE